MQEEVTQKTISVTLRATKLTGRVLAVAFEKILQQVNKERRAALHPQGRQTVKQLVGQGPSSTIPLKGSARLFDRAARKHGVDYAVRKVGPKDYVLFFKSGQADAITDTLADFTKRAMARQKDRPSILRGLRQFGESSKTRQKEREKTREAVQER